MELLCLVEIQTVKERPDTNGFEFEGEFGPIRIFAHELTQSEVEHEYDMFALRYKPDSFTATPGGLSINPTSGIIDVSASVSGTYEITASWTEPTSGKVHTSSNTITIEDPDAGFSYPLNNYCQTTLSEITPDNYWRCRRCFQCFSGWFGD